MIKNGEIATVQGDSHQNLLIFKNSYHIANKMHVRPKLAKANMRLGSASLFLDSSSVLPFSKYTYISQTCEALPI